MAKIPSIALIPSGYKATKIYSVLPTDGSADLTFNRGTSDDQTRVNSNGLIEDVAVDVPRLDYLDGGCPSLLLEPATTNLITYSEEFDNVAWVKSGTNPPTVTANQGISPKGDLTADRVEFPSTGTISILSQTFNHTLNEEYTISIYAKANSVSDNTFRLFGDFGTPSAISSVFTATTEWQRFTFTYTATANGNRGCGVYYVQNTITDILIFGIQVEQKSYATSYVPSLGTSGVRAAETASKTGLSSYINSTEGVLYAEISALANDSVEKRMGLQDAGTYDAVRITYTPTSNSITGVVYNNSANQCNFVYIVPNRAEFHKIALKYKENDFSMYVDGVLVASDNSGTTFSAGALDEFAFDVNGGSRWYGKTKNLRVYNEALSDLELATLTGFSSFAEMQSYLNYTAE